MMAFQRQSPDYLPSLPQVLLRILDAVHDDEASFAHLTDTIHQDAAIAARLLTVANATTHAATNHCQTVERALVLLGIDTVKTIVITAAIRQFFNGFGHNHHGFLKAFWRRSLTTASFARLLAELTGYRFPEQAYLCGLLTDIGQLLLLHRHGPSYLEQWQAAVGDRQLLAAEQAQFGETHCQAGAALLRQWRVDSAMADALHHHHDAVDLLADAHQLVRIINLSSLLSVPGCGNQQAGKLFGLGEELLDNLRQRVEAQAAQLAQALDIDSSDRQTQAGEHSHDLLGQRLAELSELEQARSALGRARNQDELYLTVQQVACIMTGAERPLLFLADPSSQRLQAVAVDPTFPLADIQLPLEPAHSSISNALLEQRITDSREAAGYHSDRVLLNYLSSQRLVCVPLAYAAKPLGVLVLGMSGPLPMPARTLAVLGRQIAAALADIAAPADAAGSDRELRQRIAEAIHEAGNPLSIIGNYLEVLRLKLGDTPQAGEDIPLIRQEIDRVGNILLRLKDPQHGNDEAGLLDLNPLIEQLARIFQDSVFTARRLTLKLRLNPLPPLTAAAAAPIKQILINLIKNAAEALQEGGIVVVSTAADLSEQQGFVAVTVEDNGPGIPADIMSRLFSPAVSTKGSIHTGLGLSISKRLIEELGGTITCDSGPWGTRFLVLIPH